VLGDIRNWLSPLNPRKNYNTALESRHSKTGAWFVKGNTLSAWRASGPSSLLWIHGKRQFSAQCLLSAKLMDFPFLSRGRENYPLVCLPSDILFLKIYGGPQVPQSSRRSRNRSTCHSQYFTMTSGKIKSRISMGCSHLC